TFIHFDSTQVSEEQCYISGVVIKNVNSMRFKYGVRNTVKQFSSTSPRPYITGNLIDGYISYNPRNFIWDDDIVGDGEITANLYHAIQCQPADNQEKIFLRLVGSRNSVTQANFWDIGRPSNQNDQIILLGGYNYIEGPNIPTYETNYVRNEGSYNTIVGSSVGVPSNFGGSFISERNHGTIF